MGRLRAGKLPEMRRHPSGQARVRIGRQEHWVGRYGSPEAQRRYDALIHGLVSERNGWGSSPVDRTPPAVSPQANLPATDEVEFRPLPMLPAPGQAADGALAIPPPPPNGVAQAAGITVAEICSRFLVHADRYYRNAKGEPTSTIGNYRMAVRALRAYDDVAATAFGPVLLEDMMARLVAERLPSRQEGGPPRRWPRQTINRIAKSVRFIFVWAASRELIPAAVSENLKTVRPLVKNRTTAPEYRKVKPVPDEHIDRTLPHLPKMVADMVMLQRYTGCRPDEVCKLICGEVDRSGETWIWRPDRHKNDWREIDREIAIGPRGRAILKPYLNRGPDDYCFIASESEVARNAARRAERTSPMTPSQQARRQRAATKPRPRTPYTEPAYRRAIARACDRHGIPRWNPNRIRHTAATEARATEGIDGAQARLGHTTARTTEIYAELTLKRRIEVAERLG
jgi:integrase